MVSSVVTGNASIVFLGTHIAFFGGGGIPAVWSNIVSNSLTILVFEQLIVVQRIIIRIFKDGRVISRK